MAGRSFVRDEITSMLIKLGHSEAVYKEVAQVMVEEAARMVGVLRITEGDNKADAMQSLFIACAHEATQDAQVFLDKFTPIGVKRKLSNDYI